ncbi:hypothetical protein [Sphingobacterium siyangense]|uniref:hypothetical protein n=1 Tax=Sphingobacterium siyangense TaxID=459529 RepID=UPI00301916E9
MRLKYIKKFKIPKLAITTSLLLSSIPRTSIENRRWVKEYYWYPVPQDEINKSKGRLLVQNPLWPVVIGAAQ